MRKDELRPCDWCRGPLMVEGAALAGSRLTLQRFMLDRVRARRRLSMDVLFGEAPHVAAAFAGEWCEAILEPEALCEERILCERCTWDVLALLERKAPGEGAEGEKTSSGPLPAPPPRTPTRTELRGHGA